MNFQSCTFHFSLSTSLADLLTITALELWTRIGVPKEERETEQRLLMTVEMTIEARAAAKSDDVKKSVNYADALQDLKELAKTERKTIERFAEDAARMILRKYKTASVTIHLQKFPLPCSINIQLTIRRP